MREEFRVQRVGSYAGNARLSEHRKFNAVSQPAEFRDFMVLARLLSAEVIGRKADDDEATVLVFAIERFESFVLMGLTAKARTIDDQHDLAAVLTERLRLPGL